MFRAGFPGVFGFRDVQSELLDSQTMLALLEDLLDRDGSRELTVESLEPFIYS